MCWSKEPSFNKSGTFMGKEGADSVPSPQLQRWSSYLHDGPVASSEFMQDVEKLPMQRRQDKRAVTLTISTCE
jgi:hypothetical protein